MATYLIQTRLIVSPILQEDEDWEAIDPHCEFNDLEIAFRVAHIIADARPDKEYRVIRKLNLLDFIVVPSI